MNAYTELDNYMLDANGNDYSTNFQSRDNRRIELDHYLGKSADGSSVFVYLSVSHRNAGDYTVSIHRSQVKDNIISTALVADSYARGRMSKGARYSDKNLEAVTLEAVNMYLTDEDEAARIIAWASKLVA